MAKGFSAKASVKMKLNTDASKVVSKLPGWENHLEDISRRIITGTQARARSPWFNDMRYRLDWDEKGRKMAHVGTTHSFAHWEEFGMRYWQGPIGPMRRTISGIGLGPHMTFYGKPGRRGHPL